MIKLCLAVMLGGAVGALARFGVAQWSMAHWPKLFPLPTLHHGGSHFDVR